MNVASAIPLFMWLLPSTQLTLDHVPQESLATDRLPVGCEAVTLWRRLVITDPARAGPVMTNELALRADEICHRRHVGRVAGRCEAAEAPTVLDRPQQRVMVVRDRRLPGRVIGVRDHERQHVTAAGVRRAAPARVAEAEVGRRAGEVALVPRDEDDRVPIPGRRRLDGVDRVTEELVAGRNQRLLLRE